MNIIKTKLKFIRSSKTKSWISFASINTETGRIKGVRENADCPKMICVVSDEIAPYIQEGVLYDVEMVAMRGKHKGFIVEKAEPHMFTAVIERFVVRNAVYLVTVKFGNKTIEYDLMDRERSSVNKIGNVVRLLESRKDIKNVVEVVEEFIKAANAVITAFENDGNYIAPSAR